MIPRPPSDDRANQNGDGSKKTGAKKTGAKKAAAAKKTAGKKATPAAKATAAKGAVTKKTGKGKATAKKAVADKAAAKATVPQQAVPKQAVSKRAVSKKAVPRKAVVKAALDIPEAPVSPAVAPDDRDRLLSGTHHAPHSVLGAHPVPGGVAFRVLRPYALSVTVVTDDLRTELHDDGAGFFTGLLPLRAVPDYRLHVAYEGTVHETEDAYRFLPALGELDLHLINEGRHEELWTALGA
ncbi:GlgB N-terminal domain-containing protein, partial [Streptomyces avermitilis]